MAVQSNNIEFGTKAPDFALPDPGGKIHKLSDFAGKPVLVAFICNHCPFVKMLRTEFAAFAREYMQKGIGVIGINSNDEIAYPAETMAKIADEIRAQGYAFPYVQDKSQAVAKAYMAACTPDFFLFDKSHKLFYHGQFDGARPNNGQTPTGQDLRAAADALLAGRPSPHMQKPSIGCNIKWREGNAPEWFDLPAQTVKA